MRGRFIFLCALVLGACAVKPQPAPPSDSAAAPTEAPAIESEPEPEAEPPVATPSEPEPEPEPEPIADIEPTLLTFRAQVVKTTPLADFTGTATRVHADPRFVLTLVVKDGPASDPDLVPGRRLEFAIHSPTKLFAGKTPAGRVRTFSVETWTQNDMRVWSGLALER